MTSPPQAGGGSQASDSGSGSDSFDHGRFAPGTRIGDRYRIVGRLGVGGMGEVYRADDLKLGQPVALKFLPEALEHDPLRLDKLMTEIRTARQISHPNVCRVYDVGDVDGRRFLTMEYVDGEDLRGLLRRIGRLPEDKGLEIARQICAGLAAIHDRGVLHRDLKPANVMLDGRGRVRLTDFGLATTAAAADKAGEIAGTPAYMAPEQLTGQPLSVATDLYALGLVLFELFTGERAHKSDRIEDARAGRRDAAATLTTSGSGAKLDPILQRVIERCLDPDPARRPQSAIIVAAALPGGDPLAAALAAGETPSPQMVAASGAEGGLPFKVAVPLLVALIAGVVLMAWRDGQGSYASMVNWPNSPEVMTSKAREMLVRLGYTEEVGDSASGFPSNASSGDYGVWLEEHDTGATRWQHVASVRPPLVAFWYRSSPSALLPDQYFGSTRGGGMAVTLTDPPMLTAGMLSVELDQDGRLVSLHAVPPAKIDPAAPAPTPDWPALFREAGLDLAQFAPVAPEWVSPAAADATAAWIGPGADETGAELRVEAAAFRGRPVFFRLAAPWTRAPNPVPTTHSASRVVNLIVGIALIIGIPLAAVVLSLRNVRLNRTDTRGATRIAAAAGAVVLVAAVLSSRFAGESSWLLTVCMLASWAGFSALLIWTFYAALEPYVRRRWPRMLISWSRLLEGRWRDPLVGRDLIVGSVIGVAIRLVDSFREPILRWLGEPPALPASMATWQGMRMVAAGLIAAAPEAVWLALGFVMLLVMLRLLLRSELAAAIGAVVILALSNALNSTHPMVSIFFAILDIGSWVVIATRYGLVMVAAFLFVDQPGLGGGFAAPGFAQAGVILTMVAQVALGLFGFYTATRGRKASAWLDG